MIDFEDYRVNREYEEQRGYFRMAVDCPLTFGVGSEGYVHKGTVKNLSASGLMFTTDIMLKQGDQIKASLEPENNITPPMIVAATVLRCVKTTKQTSVGGRFEVACHIKILQ